MTLIYNLNNTISYIDSSTNMTMVKTSSQDSDGNFYYNIQNSDGNLITSINLVHGEALAFIEKRKNHNTNVGDELTRLGIE